MALSFDETLSERRSVRNYEKLAVGKEELLEIVKAGTLAPSGMGKYPLVFLGLTEKTADEFLSLSKQVLGEDMYYGAPNVILVLENKGEAIEALVDLDIGASMENMLLKATALGLQTCWIHSARNLGKSEIIKDWLKKLGYGDEYLLLESIAVGHGKKVEDKKVDLSRAKVI